MNKSQVLLSSQSHRCDPARKPVRRALCLGVASLLWTFCSGCAGPAYEGIQADHAALWKGKDLDTPDMRIPKLKAEFCMRRAMEELKAAKKNSAFDMIMLGTAGVTGATGATLGATSAAMDESSRKKDVGIAGVAFVAVTGGILALRTAIALDDVARSQRIAAARSVNAAIGIVEKYALTDDPREVEDDGFGTCRDEEINVAQAFPGAESVQGIRKLIEKSKEEKTEARKEGTEAELKAQAKMAEAQTKTEAANVKGAIVANLKMVKPNGPPSTKILDLEKEIDNATKEASAASAEAASERKQAAQAYLNAAQADLTEKKLAVLQAGARLRRAMFYLPKEDVELARTALNDAVSELDTSRTALAQAKERLTKLEENAAPKIQ